MRENEWFDIFIPGNAPSKATRYFYCPGCDRKHAFNETWTLTYAGGKPTVSPSLLVDKPEHRCHLFIRNGQIQYLGDCHHKLAGQTVDMVKEKDE